MDRRSLLGTSTVALVSVTGCLDRLQNGYLINNLGLVESEGIVNDEGADEVEIVVEIGDETVHTSTHERPVDQPSENEALIISDEFPDKRDEIHVTVHTGDASEESTFDTGIFDDPDKYCIDIIVHLVGNVIRIDVIGEPYSC